MAGDKKNFDADKLTDWGTALLVKAGLNHEDAHTVALNLVRANLQGIDTHGIIRIIPYAGRTMQLSRRPISILKETGTTCLLDGGDNLGQIVSVFAMDHAIEKARLSGVCVASVRNSNHFGAAAYYAQMAADQNMLGVAMTNASPRIAPWGGLDPLVGNNPWAIALPGPNFPIVLDISNTTVANGKIRTAAREGTPIPADWAMDENGNPTTDPAEAIKGLLAPIGGYKGVGISVMVDLLSGGVSQNGFSKEIARIDAIDTAQKVGHFFMAVDLSCFLTPEEFKEMLEVYIREFKSVKKKEGCRDVFLPGEIEWNTECERKKNGIPLSVRAVSELNDLAQRLNIPLLS